MQINTTYEYGDIVFLKTDPEQLERMVCKIIACPTGLMYGVALGTIFSEHYEMELSARKDLMKELNIHSKEENNI